MQNSVGGLTNASTTSGNLRRFQPPGYAGIGVVVGSAAAMAPTRLISSLLFGISPLDPATFLTVSLLLIVATRSPATFLRTRAVQVDPVKPLRR